MTTSLCPPPAHFIPRARTDRTGSPKAPHSVDVTTKGSWPRAVFVAWLDDLMDALGVQSDNQLAGRVGISSPSVISNWRRGVTQPDVTNLRKLAQAAKVPAVQVYAMAGRIEKQDMEPGPDSSIQPLPKGIRDLIDLYHRSDEATRTVLLGQVDFLVSAIGGKQRVR